MRLLICAGGTGGGVYPALAVHNALTSQHADLQTLWVGGEGGMEARLVERANIPFKAIPAAGVHGVGLRQMPGNLMKLVRGVVASRKILRAFRPDVLFFTGGYVAVPMALAGMRLPSVLYVPDIEPGLALKTLARFADRIAVTAQDSYRYFNRRRRLNLTGYPTRPELAAWSRSKALQVLNLSAKLPTLLVLGGSKGARSINQALQMHLPALLEFSQVIHITGELDWPELQTKIEGINNPRYHAYPYLHEEMGAALAAADLVLSRAGASALGEYTLFGLPSVLVPYPFAWRYQKVNADYLVRHGAAVMLDDAKLADELPTLIEGLLKDPGRLESMRTAVKAMAMPQAAAEIGRLLTGLVMERSKR